MKRKYESKPIQECERRLILIKSSGELLAQYLNIVYLQISMNVRPILMTVIRQRLAPLQSVLFIVHATRATPATADRVSVSYKYMNHV